MVSSPVGGLVMCWRNIPKTETPTYIDFFCGWLIFIQLISKIRMRKKYKNTNTKSCENKPSGNVNFIGGPHQNILMELYSVSGGRLYEVVGAIDVCPP